MITKFNIIFEKDRGVKIVAAIVGKVILSLVGGVIMKNACTLNIRVLHTAARWEPGSIKNSIVLLHRLPGRMGGHRQRVGSCGTD